MVLKNTISVRKQKLALTLCVGLFVLALADVHDHAHIAKQLHKTGRLFTLHHTYLQVEDTDFLAPDMKESAMQDLQISTQFRQVLKPFEYEYQRNHPW